MVLPRAAALALSTTLVLAALATSPIAAADSAPLPDSIAGVGDSITQAASSDGDLGADAPRNSWSTGDNSTVNSHYLRLLALNPSVTAHNHSVSGAKVGGLAAQMESLATVKPDYVTVLIGGNDLCTDTIEEMTPTTVFYDQFYGAMETLLGDGDTEGVSEGSNVYVVSIPDVHQLWELFRNNFFARLVWSGGNICQSLLANPTSTQQADVERRAAFRERNIEYNAALQNVCALFSRCHWDGSTVFEYQFSRSDVAGDYFHPSIEGQANLAAETWSVGYQWTTDGDQNLDPTASFTFNCTGLTCDFTDTSTDSDGSVVGWSWDFDDGNTSIAQEPSHTYATGGTYTVTLTVTDDDGATDSIGQDVTVSDGSEPTNEQPTASFTFSCADLTCDFTDTSTDSDGSVVGWSWDFGDPASDDDTSTDPSPTHTYAAAATYTVTLTVTDDNGATGSASQDVTVSAPPTSITLSVTGYKVRGVKHADLSWSPSGSSTNVDVYRDGAIVATTANDGFHTDSTGLRGGGSHTFKVCEAGSTDTCSNEVSVSY